jgi:predicted TPR repeat methyltransferase
MKPLALNPAVLLSIVADGYIAYDTDSNQFHELNPAAALLVELCDGKRTAQEIAELAAPLLPPDSDAAVFGYLEEAESAGLLVVQDATGAQSEVEELNSTTLVDLANSLRDEGKVQAAYVCQQRAVELQPNDADLLRHLGELAHIVGKRDEAREAYQQYLDIEPNDAEIRHLLTSLRNEAAPDRVPDECIQQLYQRFSTFYESNMCDELGYQGPVHLGAVIEQAIGDRKGLRILDLGCGTGLAAQTVSPVADLLVGVDLSAEMLEQAKQRDIYTELHHSELTAFLSDLDRQFDLIIACDTFIYFGDLNRVLELAEKHLAPGGVIAFSVERDDDHNPFRLTDNGRYVHHPDHVSAVADRLDLVIVDQSTEFLRMEYGQEVEALYSAFRRKSE